ncbi:MAG: hypothetical protein A2589_00715 [Candidatus Vogelbacteria bacterium RIFOXYD1_FULL_46_19]|uniref:Uncharacterized protein n=1 Tax=Candidatus Vogelbacteria bacterium RIFOXYD1_FULL_46_19 TaxID=1802439 RepID=A0A1G2QII6_9BACT|nr:MAG: hypothetical protein A2589_00715 [Candidatus Vogelbacteria bacterium RIFOXYD1_FULL_46_19]
MTLGFGVGSTLAQTVPPICNRNFPNELTKNLFENPVGCACSNSATNPSFYPGYNHRIFTYYEWPAGTVWGPSMYCRYPGDPFNPPSTAVGKVEYCADLDEGRFWWRSSLQQYYTGHLQGRYASLLDFAAIKQRNGPNVPENQRQEFLFCEGNDWHECSTNQNCAYQPKGYGHSEATSKCLVNKYSPPGRKTCHFLKDIKLDGITVSSPKARVIFLVDATGRRDTFDAAAVAKTLATAVANTEPFKTVQQEKGSIQFLYIAGDIGSQIPPREFVKSHDERWTISDGARDDIEKYMKKIAGQVTNQKTVMVFIDASMNKPSQNPDDIIAFGGVQFVYMPYSANSFDNKTTIVHELGHSLFDLSDEYSYLEGGLDRSHYSLGLNVISQISVYGVRGFICHKFDDYSLKWPNCYGIGSNQETHEGLTVWKSTQNSVMNDPWEEDRYNVISCASILRELGYESDLNKAVRKCQTPPISLGIIQNENQ